MPPARTRSANEYQAKLGEFLHTFASWTRWWTLTYSVEQRNWKRVLGDVRTWADGLAR
jgi:hypothetical protein